MGAMSALPEIRFCTSVDGTRLAYIVMGSGPPLLLTSHHSLSLRHELSDEFGGRYYQALAERFTVVCYDPRNVGLSTRTGGPSSLELGVEDLDAVATAAGFERFALFGSCELGPTAVAYAAQRPSRVSALILFATFCDGPRVYRRDLHESIGGLIEAHWPMASRLVADMWAPGRDGAFVDSLARAFRDSMDVDAVVALEQQMFRTRVEELLPQVEAPVLALHREGDRLIPSTEAEVIARRCRDAELRVLPGADHWQWLGDVDRLLGAVFNFLDRQAESERPGRLTEELTPRQRQILHQVAMGRRNREIADELGISVFTVNRHVSGLLAKLDATSRTEAVHRARELNLL
jgi:pimeloyl-ACP methyl ester carboxylesterase